MNSDFVFNIDSVDFSSIYHEKFDAYKCWEFGCYNVEDDYDQETGDEWLYCDGSYTDLEKCPLIRCELNNRKICFEI